MERRSIIFHFDLDVQTVLMNLAWWAEIIMLLPLNLNSFNIQTAKIGKNLLLYSNLELYNFFQKCIYRFCLFYIKINKMYKYIFGRNYTSSYQSPQPCKRLAIC